MLFRFDVLLELIFVLEDMDSWDKTLIVDEADDADVEIL